MKFHKIDQVMRRNGTGMMISAEFCVTSGCSAYKNWQFKFTKLQSKQSRGLRRNSNSSELWILLPCTHGNSDTKHRVTTLIIAYEIPNITKHNEIGMMLSVKFCVTRG